MKTKSLTDAEHNALCTCLGYAPLQEEFRYFKRLEYQNTLIYGTIYSRIAKRDNSAICYKSTDQDSEQFGKVRFFILLDNLTAYAVTEELKCKSYCKQYILAVERTNKLVMVEVKNIFESCMFIHISESQICYICRFPNVLEYD